LLLLLHAPSPSQQLDRWIPREEMRARLSYSVELVLPAPEPQLHIYLIGNGGQLSKQFCGPASFIE
jgi:hypothetical protein